MIKILKRLAHYSVSAVFALLKEKINFKNFNIKIKKTYNYYKKLENYNIKSKQKIIRIKNSE